jgi:hypothetical protein
MDGVLVHRRNSVVFAKGPTTVLGHKSAYTFQNPTKSYQNLSFFKMILHLRFLLDKSKTHYIYSLASTLYLYTMSF